MGKKKISKDTLLFQIQREIRDTKMLCPRCLKEKQPTIDHIIPVQLLEWLGMTDEIMNDGENFQLLCEGCNKYKGNKVDITHPKTKELLLKYINKL